MKFHPLKTFLAGYVPPMHDLLSMSYTCRHEAHDGAILASTQPQISDQSRVQLGFLNTRIPGISDGPSFKLFLLPVTE